MTDEKEKAQELITTYRFMLSIPNAPLGEHKDNVAKQCALACVSEIIETVEDLGPVISVSDYEQKTDICYWLKVREELEKI